MKCSICGTPVTSETYAQHIQLVHSTPPPTMPQPPMPTPAQYAPLAGNGLPQGITPMAGSIAAKDLAGGHYLKGEDVPADTNTVTFTVLQFVKDPKARSPLVAAISPTYNKTLFGFNVTAIRALMALGFTDLQTLVGKKVVCMIGMQPNPSRGGAPSKSLFVQRVE